MFRSVAITAMLSLMISAAPAVAADDGTGAPQAAQTDVVWNGHPWNNVTWGEDVKPTATASRSTLLPALYVSYAALQAFDFYSTGRALDRGAREANPLMQGVVGSPGNVVKLKVAVGVGTIVAAERLWRTSKPAAIALMVVSNGVAAVVAANNTRTLRRLR